MPVGINQVMDGFDCAYFCLPCELSEGMPWASHSTFSNVDGDHFIFFLLCFWREGHAVAWKVCNTTWM
jgi:hypothetical protein